MAERGSWGGEAPPPGLVGIFCLGTRPCRRSAPYVGRVANSTTHDAAGEGRENEAHPYRRLLRGLN